MRRAHVWTLVTDQTRMPASALERARSAEVFTVVSSVAVLSEVSGSNTPEVVLAVLDMFVVREESTLITMVSDFFARDVLSFPTRRSSDLVRVPPPVAETKLVPAGIASDRLTPVASDGPL